MRLILSFRVISWKTVGMIDITSAYLQLKSVKRVIYVRSPSDIDEKVLFRKLEAREQRATYFEERFPQSTFLACTRGDSLVNLVGKIQFNIWIVEKNYR